jgi:predicted RNA-binding Zn-ribbon protein involved in translation (DUF1610 family)
LLYWARRYFRHGLLEEKEGLIGKARLVAVHCFRLLRYETRAKFTCPSCGQNAWAKPDAALLCGECYEADGEIIALEEVA